MGNYNVFFYTRATQGICSTDYHFLGLPPQHHSFYREDCQRIAEVVPLSKERLIYHKELTTVATKLNTELRHIVFIDDVVNEKELTPTDIVIAIPEYDFEDDCCLKIIHDHFVESESITQQLQYMKTLQFL